ncbi:C40 family peptidase [Pontibacillus sp. ALD_SL1]|uniref:C40 family peptidase n=1 Tax=Pontibacillus sp. ALD_SL1 TaxID=2777185 RepID=UPI001A95EF4F|nr:C40 family peptidase [Pontibacillus sp. ALD_SL1]QST01311.1 C40 family peptidase [Pontibacillus sp. ALD_SL1]
MLKKIVACGMAVMFTFSGASVAGAASQDDLLSVAKNHMGVPYVFGGQSPSGFDCSGYTQYVFNKVGISIPRTTGSQATVGQAVSKSNMKPGDLVFFENTYKAGISHVGIYVGNNKFISATSSKGIDIVSLSNPYWGPKFSTARRVAGLNNVDSLFADVDENHVAYEAIKALVSSEIIKGYHDGTFKPNQDVTRGQAAALFNRIIEHEASDKTTFPDVDPNHQFANDIAAMKELDIINGFLNGEFKPNETITFSEMTTMVLNSFEASGIEKDQSVKSYSAENVSRADFSSTLYDTLYQHQQ